MCHMKNSQPILSLNVDNKNDLSTMSNFITNVFNDTLADTHNVLFEVLVLKTFDFCMISV